ncbi:hypothetical protein E2C01_062058 [Portunus trituberculatus]|uniref:Uncharacterized protein n=1 Tax=Portunus trituberculatus TaxID=210409 RepID=A0A5B7H9Y5_PORTR|nr:hypothetical protein [Portunus trituberculatus]
MYYFSQKQTDTTSRNQALHPHHIIVHVVLMLASNTREVQASQSDNEHVACSTSAQNSQPRDTLDTACDINASSDSVYTSASDCCSDGW